MGREHIYLLAFWKTGTSPWRISPKYEGCYQSGGSRGRKRGRKVEAEEEQEEEEGKRGRGGGDIYPLG